MGGTKVSGLIDRDLWSVALIRCLSAVLLVLAFSSATAWAETREQRFQRIDQNGDGVISYEEHAAADEAEFAKIDEKALKALVRAAAALNMQKKSKSA